jgi:hypothetical protein
VVNDYEFVGELWQWTGEAAWYFVTLPHEVTDDIDEAHEGSRAGFGSRRVEVTVGATTWRTSVFPDKNTASYLLPVKQSVRKAEGLVEGARFEVRLRLVVEQ